MGKHIHIHVGGKTKDGLPDVKKKVREALSEASREYADSNHTTAEGRALEKVINLLKQAESFL